MPLFEQFQYEWNNQRELTLMSSFQFATKEDMAKPPLNMSQPLRCKNLDIRFVFFVYPLQVYKMAFKVFLFTVDR